MMGTAKRRRATKENSGDPQASRERLLSVRGGSWIALGGLGVCVRQAWNKPTRMGTKRGARQRQRENEGCWPPAWEAAPVRGDWLEERQALEAIPAAWPSVKRRGHCAAMQRKVSEGFVSMVIPTCGHAGMMQRARPTDEN